MDYENIEMRLLSHEGTIYGVDHHGIYLKAETIQDGTFFIELPKSDWTGKKLQLKVGFFHNNKLIENTKTQFSGPRTYR